MPDQERPDIYFLDHWQRRTRLQIALRVVTTAFICAEAAMAYLAFVEGANGAAIAALSIGVIGTAYAGFCEYNSRRQEKFIEEQIKRIEEFIKYLRAKEELERLQDELGIVKAGSRR